MSQRTKRYQRDCGVGGAWETVIKLFMNSWDHKLCMPDSDSKQPTKNKREHSPYPRLPLGGTHVGQTLIRLQKLWN